MNICWFFVCFFFLKKDRKCRVTDFRKRAGLGKEKSCLSVAMLEVKLCKRQLNEN